MGGAQDKRYNLSYIVSNSVSLNKPIIGVSVQYRLSGWGFLDSTEIRSAGATNLGIRDQRLALAWIQENIAAFGGDPTKVTIWGESAGALSVGIHVVAYGGRDDHLFRAAIGESGSAILGGPSNYNVSLGQIPYNNLTSVTGCNSSSDTLSCLRHLPFSTLNSALNNSYSFPYVDGDLITGPTSEQLYSGAFVRVPYLIGCNSDEGSGFVPQGINTDADFANYLTAEGANNASASILEILYPDIPALNIPATLTFRPNSTIGMQFKRGATFNGDFQFIAPRRLTCQQWAAYDVPAYCYRFNVLVSGQNEFYASGHFLEVAFVFYNLQGAGYAVNEFEGKPPSYQALAKLMSSAWVSFVHDLDPNGHGQKGIPEWPKYDNGAGGYGQDFLFDANVTSHPEPDTFRVEAIAYLNSHWESVFGK